MSVIKILDQETANAIKAGEVIERPVSVVKELFDNSVDAGADKVRIEISGGGIELIRVTDNGCGMTPEDAKLAFLLHATSKLTRYEDIFSLATQGFRGEALASIASCSGKVTLITSVDRAVTGSKIVYEDGIFRSESPASCDSGTVIEIRDLFKNVPARYKFLKKDSTEGMYIASVVEKLAIANPHVSVKLIKDGKTVLETPGTGSVRDAVYSVYGAEFCNAMLDIDSESEGYKIKGFAGKTSFVKNNRKMQLVFVNDRPVKSSTVSAAIDEAYRNYVMKNKFPVCVLMIYCNNGLVDVNVHPQKAEVKFANDSDVFRLVYHAIRDAITLGSSSRDDFFDPAPETVPDEPQGIQLTMPVGRVERQAEAAVPVSHKLAPDNMRKREEPKADKDDIKRSNELLEILSGFKPSFDNGEEEKISPVDTAAKEQVLAEEVVRKPSSDIEELVNSEYVGILFLTYIIMQNENNVFFVDQHAAHERVMYEKYMAKFSSGKKTESELLLVPQIINVSASDYMFISDNLDRFSEYGFDIELTDGRQIALRAVPMQGRKDNVEGMFADIMADMKRDLPAPGNIWYSLVQTTACKAAIRAGDVITKEEALSLIDSLLKLNDPYHCAHGRPTFFKISKTDFEKNFRRIV
ncbi:MAG: DNA mismatch repair endonuclease MutL [Clostridiales bacterium]|nr:DNA mismatch repair endonuclease MutL [Clostridiales bacterium]